MTKDFTLDEINLGIEKLKRRIAEVRALETQNIHFDDATVKSVERNIRETIREIFGFQSPEFHEHEHYQIWHGSYNVGDSYPDRQAKFAAGIPQTITILEGLITRLEEKRIDLQNKDDVIMAQNDLSRMKDALPKNEPWPNLQEGLEYMFSFLKIDVVGHSEIVQRNPQQEITTIFNSYKRYVDEVVSEYNGRIWTWAGDGGLITFFGNDSTQHARNAVKAAIKILDGLHFFNLEHPFENMGDKIQVRIAVHKGIACYSSKTENIHSEDINLVSHLEKQAEPQTIIITEGIQKELKPNYQNEFTESGTYGGKKIYKLTSGAKAIQQSYQKTDQNVEFRKFLEENVNNTIIIETCFDATGDGKLFRIMKVDKLSFTVLKVKQAQYVYIPCSAIKDIVDATNPPTLYLNSPIEWDGTKWKYSGIPI